jgi:hypothetical protein
MFVLKFLLCQHAPWHRCCKFYFIWLYESWVYYMRTLSWYRKWDMATVVSSLTCLSSFETEQVDTEVNGLRLQCWEGFWFGSRPLHWLASVRFVVIFLVSSSQMGVRGGAIKVLHYCRTMALGSTQPLNRNEYQEYFLGCEYAGA